MSSASSVSVIIPVYNSEACLPLLVERLERVLRTCSSDFEVLLVDDGSRDGSWNAIRELAARQPSVRGIRLMRNCGQHNALLCGIRAARCELTVTMDDDLQNPPEEIPKLLGRVGEGCDVVYGTPANEEHGLWRNLASRISKLVLQSAMGAATATKVSAFRAFRTALREAFADYRGPYVSIDVLLTWGTNAFASVVVMHDPRRLGRSNYTFRLLLRHASNMMTGFSAFPLHLASVVGFLFTVFGGILLALTLIRFLLVGTVVPGFVFLACAVTILSGAQLFALGVIGEYLARIHFRVMDRPAYTVASCTDRSEVERGHA